VASKMEFLSVISMILRYGVEDVERDIGAEVENTRPAVSEDYCIRLTLRRIVP